MEWAEDVSSKKLTTTPLRFYQLEDEKHYEIFEDNLIEELLFLSYFMGDIHQSLHVGFTSDRGGNMINVWDDSITETAEEIFYDCDVENLVKAIQNNIMKEWEYQVPTREKCIRNQNTCPNLYVKPFFFINLITFNRYASEGIKGACSWAYKGACSWAYKGVDNDFVHGYDYFLSRLPIVNWRLAQDSSCFKYMLEDELSLVSIQSREEEDNENLTGKN
ncbi:endonuclease 2 [Lactuca sativa]|uniref:endonuclease 2 n=1 Tax=Lactuca sativa TaxID=4236 RepID=UPI0022AF93C2|nr:endonuclease 2 [Lactuca sativa]